MNTRRLPPSCGLDLDKVLLANPYQQAFQAARRQRFCTYCHEPGSLREGSGVFTCPTCQRTHDSNVTAPRAFKSLHLRAGRRSGKSLSGALAVREELLVPGARWWVCGPTFKMLHDATMPTLLRLIPPDWVKHGGWNQDNLELELTNRAVVQFRSLDDPERGRGQGLHGVWLDEAAFIVERAWHVLSPSLAENAGIVVSTTSPAGFDWTYHTFFKPAVLDREPGHWAAKFTTKDNPLFAQNATLRREIEDARKRLPASVFAAEYEGEDVTFTGAIYGPLVTQQTLRDDAHLREFIPEGLERLDPGRPILVGLDSGADHPFGATKIVVTPKGLVVVGEYLVRQQAISTHLPAICAAFHVGPGSKGQDITWSSNKNEAALRLEFALRGIGIVQADNKHSTGIQRVQSWLHAKQLWFAPTVPKTIAQMLAYRYADNYSIDGQKRQTEDVFKKDDELPDCIRYALLSFPELPSVGPVDVQARDRWDRLDDRTRLDIQRVRDFNAQEKAIDLERDEPGYPIGDFFGPGSDNYV